MYFNFLKNYFLILIFSTASCLLPGCGFNPVYKESNLENEKIKELQYIQVEEIPSIAGAELYDCLTRDLNSSGDSRYILKINISYSVRPQAIQTNSDVFREILTQNIYYQLFNSSDMSVITSSSFTLSASYNTSFTPFASDVEKEQTKVNLAKAAAYQIKQRLILHFSKKFS